MTGGGPIAKAMIEGSKMIAPSAISMLPYALPGGQIIGPVATAALFGGSQYQDTYDKAKQAGLSDQEAHSAALKTGAIEGLGETIANKFSLGMLGAGKKAAGTIAQSIGQ